MLRPPKSLRLPLIVRIIELIAKIADIIPTFSIATITELFAMVADIIPGCSNRFFTFLVFLVASIGFYDEFVGFIAFSAGLGFPTISTYMEFAIGVVVLEPEITTFFASK